MKLFELLWRIMLHCNCVCVFVCAFIDVADKWHRNRHDGVIS